MWTKEIFGMDLYHIVAAFLIYSMIGWLVESVYMSICNRKVTNRGFAKGPFCPIYGFGGVLGYLILNPLQGKYIELYIAGAVIATLFEFLVGKLMLALFGELWWDYNEKPFNYQGIVCLESTIAWGFYAVIIIMFLNGKIMGLIDRYSYEFGRKICAILFSVAILDFLCQLFRVLHWNVEKYCDTINEGEPTCPQDRQAADARRESRIYDKIKETYELFRARWD